MNIFTSKHLLALAIFLSPVFLKAQNNTKPLPNWQNLDLKTDGMFGISTEKAYNELLKDKKHVPVLVAVIDGGVDINHEDLKKVIWTNPNELAGNNTDDDKNGYADDLHGWDFIGSAKGDVHFDNMEITRLLRQDMSKYRYANTDNLQGDEVARYKAYQKMQADYDKQLTDAQRSLAGSTNFNDVLSAILVKMDKKNPTQQDLTSYMPASDREAYIKKITLENWGDGDFLAFRERVITPAIKHYQQQISYYLNFDFDPRDTVGDNYTDSSERFYGNADVTGPDADHGSHVAGIIGAVRDNELGIKGVANDVMIMSVRTVPDGDERDKDVANAIRYAAANGAKVVNMSFGKGYKYDKKAVDEAVKFAMSKDVLLIHAAGNDNTDKDTTANYPNPVYEDNSGTANAWIEVGASGFTDDETLKASFSNYGKKTVDVFAPGVKNKLNHTRLQIYGARWYQHGGAGSYRLGGAYPFLLP